MTTQNVYSLTEQQKGLWFEYKLSPTSNNYNCYFHHEIKGSLDEERFFRAMRALMKAFDPFRLHFREEKHDVFQVIDDTLNEKILLFKDLSILPINEEDLIYQAKALLVEESARFYDLKSSPPTRLIFIKVSPQLFYFGISFHHIVGDGSSSLIYYRFLTDFYNHSQDLTEQYQGIGIKEYFETLNREEIYSDQAKKQSITYWKEEIKGRALQISFSKIQRESRENIQTKKVFFHFDQETFAKIKVFCKKNKTTPFLFFSACFGAFLYRYWHYQSLVIGYPVDVRPRGFQNSPGFYVSLFPLRLDLEKEVSLEELIFQITHQRRQDKEYQNIVFSELAPYLRKENKNPDLNFNVTVGSSVFFIDFNLSGLEVINLEVCRGGDNDDISLLVDFTSSDLKCELKYNSALLSEKFIKSFISHFKTFVTLALDNPNEKISEVCFLSEEEKQQLLVDWNETKREYPQDKTIHQLFEEQVEKAPANIAVVFEEEQLTYHELNAKANQLAHYLREQGVKPDTLVAIACERSLEMIVSILGILKAGGAYVPIDPSYPEDRIGFMLEDTSSPILLTQESLLEKLPGIDAKVFLLDKQQESLVGYPATNPSCITQPHHLAYIIYTSGSTGKPKGVMIEHKSVNRLVFGQTYVTIHSSSVVAQASNISFDAATFEIWGTLLFGAKLVIIPTNMVLSAVRLQDYVKKNNISIMWITKTLFDQLFDQDSTLFKDFNYLLIGGEALDPLRVRKIVQEEKVKNLINGYGPTESTTFAVCCNLNYYQNLSQSIPIGQPIANTQVYILDSSLHPVPVGVVGELYIGGAGLARGYLNQPELTEERFIKNPLVGEDNQKAEKNLRFYKTGDLCRWLEDGNIEYVGRIDDQVKLRGFRIELGEIESILKQHPETKDGIVLMREDTPGDKRLVGYLIFKKDRIDTEMLKSFLKDKLPEYMIPSAFVTLDCFPLTPNGKVDRKGLPTPEYKGDDEKYVPPSTDAEKLLAEIWKDILKIEKIGIHDNFFELGGHSLLATQVVSRIRLYSQKDVSLKTFFNCPTIFELSSIMEEKYENKKKIPSILTRRREVA